MSGPTGLRLFALAAALAWLAAMPAAPARAAGPGAITGAVQNGTVGAAIPAGLVVGLETYRGAIPVASQTVTAGPDGSFAFSDLDTGPEYGFVARTTHAGVLYGTDLIRLDADGRAAATITVHEITPDDPGVSLRTATRFLRRRSAEVISVLEVAELQVPGDRTFVPQARPGVPPPIRFGLPAEAFNLEPLSGFGSTDAVFGGPGFGVYAPLRPGLATLAFGFEVALTDGAGAFAWTIGKPVDRVRVLGDVDGLDVRVTGLDEIGLDQVGDAVVRRWEGQALPAGAIIGIQVADTSMPGLVRALRATTADRWAVILGAAGLAIAVALAGWRHGWRRAVADPVTRADALAQEFASLGGAGETTGRGDAIKRELVDLAARHPEVRTHLQAAARPGADGQAATRVRRTP